MGELDKLPELGSWDDSKLLLAHELNRTVRILNDLVTAIDSLRETVNKMATEMEVQQALAHQKAYWIGGISGAVWAAVVTFVSAVISRVVSMRAH